MALPKSDGGPLKIGAPFADKYEIKGLIGHGGQAWVYRGQHTFTGREVAIKIIHAPYGVTHEMLERAKAEAQALAKLNHNNVVTMHDAGVTAEGQLYILMELLVGCSLGAVLTEFGRLGIEETLRLLIQAADAVHQAHKRRIIHRDLKPDNLFVIRGDHEGKGNPLKVLDFGIAKMLDEIGFTTRKDVVIGTVLYMSPEQVQGLPITEQSDIYALGLIMWEALIGKRPSVLIFERDLIDRGEPFRRPGIADIPPIQANRIPPLLTELEPDIPMYVSQLVQRAIAKVARQRFSTMGDFATAMRVCLDRYLAEVPVGVRPPNRRDLSQFVPKPVEAEPVSQRATAKHQASESSLSAHAVSAASTARIELPAGLQSTRGMKLSPPVQQQAAAPPSPGWPIGVETETIGTSPAASSQPVAPSPEPARNRERSDPPLAPAVSQPVPAAPTPSVDRTRPTVPALLKPVTPPPVSVNPRDRGRAVAHSNRIKVRNALISGGLLGLLLGAVLMRPTMRVEPLPSPLSRAGSVASVMPNPVPVSLPMVPPTTLSIASANVEAATAEAAPSAVRSSTALEPAQQPSPPAPAPRPIARPTKVAAAKPADKMEQRLPDVESGLGTDRIPSPKPSASATHRKAIYGD